MKRITSQSGIFARLFAVLGLATLALTLAGCGKKEKPAPPTTAETTSAANVHAPAATTPNPTHAPRPQNVPAAPAQLANSASADAAAALLSNELRKYVAYTRTIPKNFDDFIARHPMKFPPPPAGKNYVIEGAQVVVR